MKDKEKNQLLVMATALCFIFGADRLYRFQYEHIPVAAIGECIRVSMPNGQSLDYTILDNDSEVGYSTIRMNLGVFPEQISYAQLKDSGAKKVACYETGN